MLAFYLTLATEKDRSTLEQIYIKHKNLMLSRAYEILGDSELAEDAVHNAFLRLMKNMSKLEDAYSPRTRGYVLIVTENVAKSIYVKQRKTVPIELDETIPDTKSVSSEVVGRITAELLAEKIGELPAKYREVLLLKSLHNMNDRQIADSLGINQATARKRIERARAALKKLIGGSIDG